VRKLIVIVLGGTLALVVLLTVLSSVHLPCLGTQAVCAAQEKADRDRIQLESDHAADLDGWGRFLEKSMIVLAVTGVASVIVLAVTEAGLSIYILFLYRRRRLARGERTMYEVAEATMQYDIEMADAQANFLGGVQSLSVGQLSSPYDQPSPLTAQASYLLPGPQLDFLPAPATEDEVDGYPTISLADAVAATARNQWQMIPGVGVDGGIVRRTLAQTPQNLIMGASGQGKSTLAAVLLTTLVAGNDHDHFELRIGDIEGITSQPFADYAEVAQEPEEIVQLLEQHAAEIIERRSAWQNTGQRGMPTYPQLVSLGYPIRVMYIEEALALNTYLDDKQYSRYITAFEQVALLGRKWGHTLMTTKQVDYSDDDFKRAMRQFLGKYLAAVDPAVARSQGFRNNALVQELYDAALPGLFLSQQPGGAQLVRAATLPDLDIIQPIIARYRQVGGQASTAYEVVRTVPTAQIINSTASTVWPTATSVATSTLTDDLEVATEAEAAIELVIAEADAGLEVDVQALEVASKRLEVAGRHFDASTLTEEEQAVLRAWLRPGATASSAVAAVYGFNGGGGSSQQKYARRLADSTNGLFIKLLAALNTKADGAETTELVEVGS